jgi:hypothetical protein
MCCVAALFPSISWQAPVRGVPIRRPALWWAGGDYMDAIAPDVRAETLLGAQPTRLPLVAGPACCSNGDKHRVTTGRDGSPTWATRRTGTPSSDCGCQRSFSTRRFRRCAASVSGRSPQSAPAGTPASAGHRPVPWAARATGPERPAGPPTAASTRGSPRAPSGSTNEPGFSRVHSAVGIRSSMVASSPGGSSGSTRLAVGLRSSGSRRLVVAVFRRVEVGCIGC